MPKLPEMCHTDATAAAQILCFLQELRQHSFFLLLAASLFESSFSSYRCLNFSVRFEL